MSRATYILNEISREEYERDREDEEFWTVIVDSHIVAPDVNYYSRGQDRVKAMGKWLIDNDLGRHAEHVTDTGSFDSVEIHVRGGEDEARRLANKISEILPPSEIWRRHYWPVSALASHCRGNIRGEYREIGYINPRTGRYVSII